MYGYSRATHESLKMNSSSPIEKNNRARRLQAAVSEARCSPIHLNIRGLARKYNVPNSSLQRALSRDPSHQTPRLGRPPVLSEEEEKPIVDAVVHFSKLGTPLSRNCFKDLVKVYVDALPLSRRRSLPFIDGRPGDFYVHAFLKRHNVVTLRRRANLEKHRAMAMSPNNLAVFYARLEKVYKEYNIHDCAQIFNLDESGCSVRNACRSRAKALFETGKRSNSVDLKWSNNAEHITIMPVVSADGTVWAPVVVLPGLRAKFRTRADGNKETPSDFLPHNALISYRDPAGVDSHIFFQWAEHFVRETETLRNRHRHIVLLMDGYAAHVTYKTLKYLTENRVIVVALPAHTSHRTQVLDYTVFSPFKTSLRNALNRRASVSSSGNFRSDVYTLCEIIHSSYRQALTYDNITKGFKSCGIWCQRRKGTVPEVINDKDITNWDGYVDRTAARMNYIDLVQKFKATTDCFRSDGAIIENGTVNTKTGALLSSSQVLGVLKDREVEREKQKTARTERQAAQIIRRAEREASAVMRQVQRSEQAKREHENAVWLQNRPYRARLLSANRETRRRMRRLSMGTDWGASEDGN